MYIYIYTTGRVEIIVVNAKLLLLVGRVCKGEEKIGRGDLGGQNCVQQWKFWFGDVSWLKFMTTEMSIIIISTHVLIIMLL